VPFYVTTLCLSNFTRAQAAVALEWSSVLTTFSFIGFFRGTAKKWGFARLGLSSAVSVWVVGARIGGLFR
jgi:hypothetical protein